MSLKPKAKATNHGLGPNVFWLNIRFKPVQTVVAESVFNDEAKACPHKTTARVWDERIKTQVA
jgi:hypothetical protein